MLAKHGELSKNQLERDTAIMKVFLKKTLPMKELLQNIPILILLKLEETLQKRLKHL